VFVNAVATLLVVELIQLVAMELVWIRRQMTLIAATAVIAVIMELRICIAWKGRVVLFALMVLLIALALVLIFKRTLIIVGFVEMFVGVD
jgi:hypothetical protein